MVGAVTTLQYIHSEINPNDCQISGCSMAASTLLHQNQSGELLPEDTDADRVVLLSAIPKEILQTTQIPVEVAEADTVIAYAQNTSRDTTHRIELRRLGNSKYEVEIDPAELQNGRYTLSLRVTHSDRTTPTKYSLGDFIIENELEEADTVEQTDFTPTVTQSEAQTTSEPQRSESEPDVEQIAVETTEAEAEIEEANADEQQNTEAFEERLTTFTPRIQPDLETFDESSLGDRVPESLRDTLAERVQSETTNKATISAPQFFQGLVSIAISSTPEAKNAQFYIRHSAALQSQKIATLAPDQLSFEFDSQKLPNGEYELYAQVRLDDDQLISTNSLTVRIFNSIQQVEFADTSVIQSELQERELITPIAELESSLENTRNRTAETVADFVDEQETRKLVATTTPINTRATSSISAPEPRNQAIREQARELLLSDKDELDRLFTAYAAAEQAGDAAVLAEAKEEIERYRTSLVNEALTDERQRFIARDLEQDISAEIENLKDKVRTFENIRKERTENDSSLDTDGDGISDVDERVLYKTDPLAADSDNDGFTDGVEIMNGFNPLDETPEVPVVYESPKEAIAVVQPETFVVEEVIPDVQLQTLDETETVQTVVRGRALPNSFVTLYIFSTPTIVTVRTESDGSFEYTFSKELEDGEHEVFVALTDNAGSVVATSEPFTFVKEAQAFTPVDALATEETLENSYTEQTNSPYRLVLAMSVFSLGILLLLLGIGLRTNKPDDPVVQQEV